MCSKRRKYVLEVKQKKKKKKIASEKKAMNLCRTRYFTNNTHSC